MEEDTPIDAHANQAAPDALNCAVAYSPPTGDDRMRWIGERVVDATIPGILPDRTGELIDKVHHALGDKHMARIVGVEEPDTGTRSLVVLHPNGVVGHLRNEVFDEYRDAPKCYRGVARVTRIESFIDHVTRFKDPASALFAKDDMERPELMAVLDYSLGRIDGEVHAPRYGQHRTLFQFPLSDEWKKWTGKNGAKMGLTEFAEFIEDRFIDVEQVTDVSKLNGDIQKLVGTVGAASLASPSALIELSRGLKVHVKDEVTNAASIASGEVEVQFKSEHTDKFGNKLSVPSLFILNIPVFARGEVYRVAARLRYRVKDGALTFWYELWGIDRVFELAFTDVCEAAREKTGLPLIYGQPE